MVQFIDDCRLICLVAGGYKATLKNPNVSAEAKEHARRQLERMKNDYKGHYN